MSLSPTTGLPAKPMAIIGGITESLSSLPSVAAQASESTLNAALKAVGISNESAGSSEGNPVEAIATEEEAEKSEMTKGQEGKGEDLEEGEVEQTNEEKSGAAAEASNGKTVLHDPSNFDVKHPLFSSWSLYFTSPNSKSIPWTEATAAAPLGHGGGWLDEVRKVVTFDSVEEFWGLYNNIVVPSQLPPKCDYFLFKEDIIPAWEDEANRYGGKWAIQLPREKSKALIDKMWLYTMLAAIGETFEADAGEAKDLTPPSPEDADLVTGVIISTRPNFYRINVWTRSAPDDPTVPSPLMERILRVGRHFKTSVLGMDLGQKLAEGGAKGFQTDVEFQSHKDSEKKNKGKKAII